MMTRMRTMMSVDVRLPDCDVVVVVVEVVVVALGRICGRVFR